ncbi:hypothetical protein ACFX1T_009998 [Malus domestica]
MYLCISYAILKKNQKYKNKTKQLKQSKLPRACHSPPLQHFDLPKTAFLHIAKYRGRIVACSMCDEGIRFTINGHSYFNLVLIRNVGGAGDVRTMSTKGSRTGWLPMSRNRGGNWQSNSYLKRQRLSFRVTTSDGRRQSHQLQCSARWQFGQTIEGGQF